MPAGGDLKNFEGTIILNEVAAFIWKQLESPISRDDQLQAVFNEYDTDAQSAGADLDRLLERFEGFGDFTRRLI